jgi:hypothetical protein
MPTVQNPDVGLFHAPDGMTYLTRRSANGEIIFTPVSAIVSQSAFPAPQTATQIQPEPVERRETNPLATVAVVLAAVLGLTFTAWFIGFLAGRSGRETVVVPRGPICTTRRSSFLMWSHTEQDCH